MSIKKYDEISKAVDKHECWLCLRVADVSDSVLFSEIHKEILEVLLANDVTNSLGSFICNNCISMLHESFAFKSTCLYTEDDLTPFIKSKNFSKLDIFTVFCEVNKNKTELLLKNLKICRFCLKILEKVSYSFLKNLNEPDLEMLKKVTPEVQLEAITDPIICEICLQCFRDSLEFIDMCLNALERGDSNSGTSLNNNLAHMDDDGGNLVSSEADSEDSRESNDGSILNPNEIKWEPDLFESSDTTCLKIDHASDEESSQTFKCHVCDFDTGDEDSLAVHTNVHNSSEVKLEISEECTFQSEYKYNLAEHNLVHKKPDEIELCKRQFQSKHKNLQKHEKLSDGHLYKCQLCQYSTKYKYNLQIHHLVHKASDETKLYKCQLCQFSTKYKGDLRKHHLVHKASDETTLYKCQLCEYSTKYKYNLRNHQLVHKIPEETKLYECQLCQFSTKYKNNIRSHYLRHKTPDETKLHKCQLCQYSTKYKGNLRSHHLVHKTPDETTLYKCQLCQFSTKYKDDLRKHHLVHKTSDETTLYKCQLCQYSTKNKGHLRTHHLVHKTPDETKLYKCQLCEYSTKYKGVLRTHHLVHKTSDETKLHKCQLCQFSTKYKGNLTKHQKVHKEAKLHKCKLCQFSTNHKKSLKRHKLVHITPEEAKLYKCQLCQYSTKYKCDLPKHQQRHK